jgi:hypothetical protein
MVEINRGVRIKAAGVWPITCLLTLCVTLAGTKCALAFNPQEPGPGCVPPGQSEHLGAVEDRLAERRVVPFGIGDSSPVLRDLRGMGEGIVSIPKFLKSRQTLPGEIGDKYILLINASLLQTKHFRRSAAMVKAMAFGVPIVLENLRAEHLKAIAGLGLEADIVVLHSYPGSRAITVSAFNRPAAGTTPEFAGDAVNRALLKHEGFKLGDTPPIPARQAYAAKVWNVWLHNNNIVCQPPYDVVGGSDPQIGNLDFGIRITLVASLETSPPQKAVDLQYIGSGFSPLAPGVVPIDVNNLFKGAFTLELDYSGQLIAPPAALLTGTADTVAPATAVDQHTVAKTSGFSFGVSSSCGANMTGPNCSIGGSFNYMSSKTNGSAA